MNLKICAVGLVATLFAHSALSATTYTWQAVDGSYDGLFTDPAHWGQSFYPGQETGDQTAAFAAAAGRTSHIYFPDGTFDNYSAFRLYVADGQSTWFIGTNTTWNLPLIEDGTKRDTCVVYLNAATSSTAKNGSAFRDALTDASARLKLKNFKIEHSSTAERGTCLDIWEGDVSSSVANWFYSDNNKIADKTGRFELCFHPGTTSTLGGLYIGSMTPTNAFTFLGGTHTLGNWRQQFNVGNPDAGTARQVDFTFKGGATVKFGAFGLGYTGTPNSRATTYHVYASEGANVTSPGGTWSCGTFDVDISGANTLWTFSNSSYFGSGANSKFKFRVADGAKVSFTARTEFGASTAAALENNEMDILVTNATLDVNAQSVGLKLYSGSLSVVDSNLLIGWGGGVIASPVDGATPTCYLNGARSELTTTAAFLSGFQTVALGNRGYTVYSKHPVTAYNIAQSFSDAPGESGELCLGTQYTGIPYTLAANSTESRLVVSNGTVKLAAGANHYSHLTVRSGATFSMKDNATTATLRGLALGTGSASVATFELDLTDTVRVEGPVSLVNGVFKYSSVLPVGTTTVFTSTEATADAIENWQLGSGFSIEGLPEGKFISYDTAENEGVTSFQVVIRSELPEAQGSKEWQDGSGLDASWIATFTGVTPKSVSVDGAKEVGGLSFTEGGYVLSGGKIAIKRSTSTAAGVSVAADEVEIASEVNLCDFGDSLVEVFVAEGATLTISGRILGAGIRKTGSGRLVLSNAGNRMPQGVVLAGGLLSAVDPLTLGGEALSSAHSKLADGTLEIVGNESNGVPGSPLDIESSVSETKAVVVKADVDATLRLGGDGETGASLFKRGEGALAFQVDGDLTLNVKSDHATSLTKNTVLEFPASGEGPDVPRGSINVAEGELAFRAGKGNPKLTVPGKAANGDARQCLYLTYPYADAAADPKFVLDGVALESTGHATHFANCLTAANSPKVHPELHVTNGAYMSVWMFSASENSNKAGLDSKAVFDNGALYTQAFYANAGGTIVVTNHYEFRNGSGLYVTAQNQFQGPLVMVFDRSKYARNAQGDVADTLALSKEFNTTTIAKVMDLSFVNGSYFGCPAINRNSGTCTSLAKVFFDDSEWFCGDADKTIPSTTMNVVTTAGEGGLVMAPPAGRTWTWVGPLEGEGGLVKKGAGTVLFGRRIYLGKEHEDPATLKCMGVNDVQAGTLALAEGAVGAAGAKFHVDEEALLDLGGVEQSGLTVSGNGTVANGTLTRASVAVDPNAVEAPLLDFANGLDASGRMTLDFGEVSEQVLSSEVAVARYTGTLPAGLSFRVKGRTADGRLVSGAFRVADGVIYATPQVRGLMILVR